MTDITITKTEKVAVKYLKVCANVRYWEDATVNGALEDDGNPTIPCRDGRGNWAPLIELATGKVIDWPAGTTASTHYKVCDEGRYALLREDMSEVCVIDGYVPSIMSPGGQGWGDYIIMDIGADGQIADWIVDLERFEEIGKVAQ